MMKSVKDALEMAEGFIAGFEDDPNQEGIPFLLQNLRAAIDRLQLATPEQLTEAVDEHGVGNSDLSFDADAIVSEAEEGFWVSCWAWVSR